jgi:L-lactate dehydrogenase complex protein LldF
MLGGRFKSSSDLALSCLSNAEELRNRARAIRESAIAHLPQLLETLESNVKKVGGTVHWAATAKDARRIIVELVHQKGVQSVVKGKSMVSEEIGLNDALTRNGTEVWETDLGEFIIQLAGEPPAHIIVPAVHKSVDDISRLFTEKLNASRVETPETLTMIARKQLRGRFLRADMGITGANMAVAETGSILLVENEGNIRLSTTVPRIHVAIMGIERVVPTLEDLGVLVSLLARSATGQKLSTYTSLITGPRRENEMDGSEEFHLILIDNGRTRILADPSLRETLYCIRCGACLNSCPVYLKVGGHSYGWVYPGPIGSVLTTQLVPPRLAKPLPFASTLCGACAEACPVKIDLPKLLLTLRQRLVEDSNWDVGISPLQRIGMAVYTLIAAHSGLYKAATSLLRRLEALLAPSGRWICIPPLLRGWARSRALPSFTVPFSHRWPTLRLEIQRRKDEREKQQSL